LVTSGVIHRPRLIGAPGVVLLVNLPRKAKSAIALRFFLWSLYSALLFRSTSARVTLPATVTWSGVGSSYFTRNCPETSGHPAAVSVASAMLRIPIRTLFMNGPPSGHWQPVGQPGGSGGEFPGGAAGQQRIELSADVERHAGQQ